MKVKSILLYYYFISSITHIFSFQQIFNRSLFSNGDLIQTNGTRKNFIETILIPLPFKPEEFGSQSQDDSDFDLKKEVRKTFSDIGGYHPIKEELLQLKEMFDKKEVYRKVSITNTSWYSVGRTARNGKTLLAKCFAGECKILFYYWQVLNLMKNMWGLVHHE